VESERWWDDVKEEKKFEVEFEGEAVEGGVAVEGEGGAGERVIGGREEFGGMVREGAVTWTGDEEAEEDRRPGREMKYSSRREKKASWEVD